MHQPLIYSISTEFLLVEEFFFDRVFSFLRNHREEAPSHRFANAAIKVVLRLVMDDLGLFSKLFFSSQRDNLFDSLVFGLQLMVCRVTTFVLEHDAPVFPALLFGTIVFFVTDRA